MEKSTVFGVVTEILTAFPLLIIWDKNREQVVNSINVQLANMSEVMLENAN